MTKTLEVAAGIDIEMIAPSHGVIWRSHVADIVKCYSEWAVCKPAPKVLVIYDSMWDATGQMARAIHAGASVAGVQAELIFIRTSNITKIATEVMDAACVAFGSSTLNATLLPQAGAALLYLHGLRPVDKTAFAFGSYGWGMGGPSSVNEWLEKMKWEIIREPIRTKYNPDEETLEICFQAGRELAQKALEITGNG